jgi:hypothetical protein
VIRPLLSIKIAPEDEVSLPYENPPCTARLPWKSDSACDQVVSVVLSDLDEVEFTVVAHHKFTEGVS